MSPLYECKNVIIYEYYTIMKAVRTHNFSGDRHWLHMYQVPYMITTTTTTTAPRISEDPIVHKEGWVTSYMVSECDQTWSADDAL